MQQPTSTYQSGRDVPTVRWLWLACLIAFSALYLATCQRGVCWQDSGRLQWNVQTAAYETPLGLALVHPLLIAAGQALKQIPIADLATRLNFFSGLGMAVALANLACLIAVVTGRRWIGAATAAMLGVAHTPWWLATITETYTWTAAGLTAELWLMVSLIRKPRAGLLIAIALVSGLGLNLHNLALLLLPVYAAIILVLRRKLPLWSLAAAAGAYCLGAGPYIAMTVHLAVRTGDVSGAIRSALFGNNYAKAVLNVSARSKYYQANAVLAAMNFVSFLGPLAVVGWAHLRRKLGVATASAVAAITIIEVLFVIRYPVPDQFTFLLPTLVMVALAAGVGIGVMADASTGMRKLAIAACVLSIVVPPVFYAAGPSLARWGKPALIRQKHKLPFRDELRYWLVPWKHNEQSAEMFAQAALRQASPDGVIISDSTAVHPLLLVQARDGLSPAVSIQYRGRPLPPYARDTEAFRKALGKRRLYTVSSRGLPTELLKDVTLSRPEGAVLYLARWKRP